MFPWWQQVCISREQTDVHKLKKKMVKNTS